MMIILNEAGQGMWEEEGQVSCKAAGISGRSMFWQGATPPWETFIVSYFKMMRKEYYFLDPRDDFFNFSDCFNWADDFSA